MPFDAILNKNNNKNKKTKKRKMFTFNFASSIVHDLFGWRINLKCIFSWEHKEHMQSYYKVKLLHSKIYVNTSICIYTRWSRIEKIYPMEVLHFRDNLIKIQKI